jgi:hypothetical protein
LRTLGLKTGSCTLSVEKLNRSQKTKRESAKEAGSLPIMFFTTAVLPKVCMTLKSCADFVLFTTFVMPEAVARGEIRPLRNPSDEPA